MLAIVHRNVVAGRTAVVGDCADDGLALCGNGHPRMNGEGAAAESSEPGSCTQGRQLDVHGAVMSGWLQRMDRHIGSRIARTDPVAHAAIPTAGGSRRRAE